MGFVIKLTDDDRVWYLTGFDFCGDPNWRQGRENALVFRRIEQAKKAMNNTQYPKYLMEIVDAYPATV